MLPDEWPDMDMVGPARRGGTSVSLTPYVTDVDLAFARALSAGAREERAVEDQFYGDRTGTLIDPFGHRWSLATQIEDVAPQDMQRRLDAMTGVAADADA